MNEIRKLQETINSPILFKQIKKINRNYNINTNIHLWFPSLKEKYKDKILNCFHPKLSIPNEQIQIIPGNQAKKSKENLYTNSNILKTNKYFNIKLNKEIAELSTMYETQDQAREKQLITLSPVKIKNGYDLYKIDSKWKKKANYEAFLEEEKMYFHSETKKIKC